MRWNRACLVTFGKSENRNERKEHAFQEFIKINFSRSENVFKGDVLQRTVT